MRNAGIWHSGDCNTRERTVYSLQVGLFPGDPGFLSPKQSDFIFTVVRILRNNKFSSNWFAHLGKTGQE